MLPLIGLLSVLVFFHRLGEAPLKFDGLTYSALAKHIVESGVWTRLHYTPSAYDSFYQHPPLFIWMQAAAFHFLPMTDAGARVLPSLFGIATLLLLFIWTRALASAWAGLLAVLTLLLAYPYLKYASDAYLEGPLVFFTLLGLWACARAFEGKQTAASVAVFGFAVWAALMTKGIVALALPAAALSAPFCLSGDRQQKQRWLGQVALGIAGAAAGIAVWLAVGDGWNYLAHYWQESVAARAVSHDWASRLQFGWFLVSRSAPATLLFLVSLVALARRRQKLPAAVVLCLAHCAFVALGHSFSGKMHEHYLIQFFPTAALVVGFTWQQAPVRLRSGVARGVEILVVGLCILLACWPGRVRSLRSEPARLAAAWIAQNCDTAQVREVIFTGAVTEKWLGLANLIWYLPGDARHWENEELAGPPSRQSLLILPPQSSAPAGWEKATITPWVRHSAPAFAVFQPQGTALCLVPH